MPRSWHTHLLLSLEVFPNSFPETPTTSLPRTLHAYAKLFQYGNSELLQPCRAIDYTLLNSLVLKPQSWYKRPSESAIEREDSPRFDCHIRSMLSKYLLTPVSTAILAYHGGTFLSIECHKAATWTNFNVIQVARCGGVVSQDWRYPHLHTAQPPFSYLQCFLASFSSHDCAMDTR